MLKISTYNPTNHIVFGNKQKFIFASRTASLNGSTISNLNSLRTVTKDILSRYEQAPEMFLAKLKDLSGVELGEKAISYLFQDKTFVELSMPNGIEENIFRIRVSNSQENIKDLTFDEGRIVKSLNNNKAQYYNEGEIDTSAIGYFINDIYSRTDEKLFETRMWARKIQPELAPKPIKKTVYKPEMVFERDEKPEITISEFSFQELLKKSLIVPQKIVSPRFDQLKRTRKKESVVPQSRRRLRKLNVETSKENKEKFVAKEVKPKREIINTPLVKKPVKQPKPVSRPNVQVGLISAEIKEKINNVKTLKAQIMEITGQMPSTSLTRVNRFNSDNAVITRRKIRLADDFVLFSPERKIYEEYDILNIRDLHKNQDINIANGNKIVKNDINWNYKGILPRLKFFSTDELQERISDFKLVEKLDFITEKLHEYINYLRTKGWKNTDKNLEAKSTTYKKKVKVDNSTTIDKGLMTKIANLGKKFYLIRDEMERYQTSKRVYIRRNYANINPIASTRLEFVNPEKDGYNLSFDLSSISQGDFTKIVKLKSSEELKEVYLISKEGKIVKNHGKKHVYNLFPTSSKAKLFYYSEQELMKNNVLENLQNHIETLDKCLDEYYKYLLTYRK